MIVWDDISSKKTLVFVTINFEFLRRLMPSERKLHLNDSLGASVFCSLIKFNITEMGVPVFVV